MNLHLRADEKSKEMESIRGGANLMEMSNLSIRLDAGPAQISLPTEVSEGAGPPRAADDGEVSPPSFN